MIKSAEEFIRIRSSSSMDEQHRASRDEAPIEVWQDVIARFPEYREWVAHNKTIPLSILEVLVSDPNWRVRSAVSRKRKASTEILEVLADDKCETVRLNVARHKKTSRATLEKLKDDPWSEVRKLVAERLNGPVDGDE